MPFSSRAAAISSSKKRKWEEEEEDSTKDMDDPPSETNIQEVHNPNKGSYILSCVSVNLKSTYTYFCRPNKHLEDLKSFVFYHIPHASKSPSFVKFCLEA